MGLKKYSNDKSPNSSENVLFKNAMFLFITLTILKSVISNLVLKQCKNLLRIARSLFLLVILWLGAILVKNRKKNLKNKVMNKRKKGKRNLKTKSKNNRNKQSKKAQINKVQKKNMNKMNRNKINNKLKGNNNLSLKK